MMEFKHTLKVLDDFGKEIITNYRSELEADNKANGELYRTLSYTVKQGTSGWVISVSLEEYWRYIEYGRKPGKFPPLSAIENWIKVKQIIPHPMTLKSGKTVLPSIKQLSFLIARSISQKGIPAKPFFKNSFEAAKSKFLESIEQAITEDITEGLS